MQKFTASYKLPGKTEDHIVLRELTLEEQLQITTKFDGPRMVQELYAQTVVELRGKKIGGQDGENRQAMWSSLTAPQRDLVSRIYRKNHMATEKDANDFLDSEEQIVTL